MVYATLLPTMTVSFYLYSLAGAFLALASLVPETLGSTLSAFLCAVMLWLTVKHEGVKLWGFYLCGNVFHLIAFYWLPETITRFGGFGPTVAFAFFVVFCLFSSLQFLLCGYLCRRLRQAGWGSLSLSAAWLVSSLIIPRMFPWAIAHSLVSVPLIAGLAEYVGVPWLDFLLVWWGVSAVELVFGLNWGPNRGVNRRWASFAPVAIASVLAVLLGLYRDTQLETELAQSPSVRLALVQGNLIVRGQDEVAKVRDNLEVYRSLSQKAAEQGAQLLLWPESSLNIWMHENTPAVGGTRLDPAPGLSLPILYGGLSFNERPEQELQDLLSAHPSLREPRARQSLKHFRYNTAIGVSESREVLGLYHKRALMPFGEYIPFADKFPWIKAYSPNTGDFTVGTLTKPIEFVVQGKGPDGAAQEVAVRASSLICYEDLVPDLAREAVREGGNLLVNLTNDVWYGRTAAPYQHHLLALWRAIEARRYLLRVTNTGYTAVVTPRGHSSATLPIFEEGLLVEEVQLLESSSVYSKLGDFPAWLFSGFVLFAIGASISGISFPTESSS